MDCRTEGGGVPGNRLTITYNADGGHKEWVDALCNSIRQNTGVECVGDPKVDFKTARTAITGHTVNGAFRTGWIQDYPLNANLLADVYRTGAASNDFGYSSPQFDQLADQADRTTASRPRSPGTSRPRPCSRRTCPPSRSGTTGRTRDTPRRSRTSPSTPSETRPGPRSKSRVESRSPVTPAHEVVAAALSADTRRTR
ncbi:hypothetical protein GCM10010495_76020 [Kitasatospora herbaricolor]|uniref:hypothetical protein n=1 Tax=Kitasatospora herbaricolor TaxID=68217 RepID=UPI00174CE9BA|nr:hypothetical protein [Kitasatospora herbaricolor]MDQ0305609.1 hypothetical protein [Kitasatospora herbaricolor]GGV47131.1 hypothetical protein GCM10010495_76020 [Kitasatospora herbaricolor]